MYTNKNRLMELYKKRDRLIERIIHINKKEAEIENDIKRIFEIIEKKAEIENDPLGYHINFKTFQTLLEKGYGRIYTENEQTLDNCYIHRLVSLREVIFKTITKEKKYFEH